MALLSTTANLANESSGMSDDLKGAIITALVTGIISIIGFIVTNTSMKKNFKNELKRQRDSVALERMSTMPYELVLTTAESKATYEEIKDYVLEHSGLKVSNLYIAQVKQKCGIIERVNYNLSKSENAKQSQCPSEKEKAIKEALRHFGMI